ncbi:rRNA maturation RNase YbeY [Tenacibaculum finnmarkense genomovar ulcerans]|uniref:rRNA maturation RNase YbeY n=1 Tax=Tenacibaculum finnmarkense TaxID=2781243 RepID=UPI001E401B10|nr:rRNA maturation RNase YbeY [Tenacibaculum finnmarkense]MCD8453579.1 rRNA maturation RNase YbeY [Tenacibaculum finnmarkense genomovar ulcerans]
MIEFNYETDFQLKNEEKTAQWVLNCIEKEGFELGEINYVFCNDTYLHKMNVEFLQHDTLTDIISFDYTLGKLVGGDIFISIERVKENAKEFDVLFENELHRVIIHGVLHYMKYKDKTDQEKQLMRTKENDSLKLLNLN